MQPRKRPSRQKKELEMYYRELARRQEEANPIRVGASAIEWMGSGLIAAFTYVPGMEISAVANQDVEEGKAALAAAGVPQDQIKISDRKSEVEDLILSLIHI